MPRGRDGAGGWLVRESEGDGGLEATRARRMTVGRSGDGSARMTRLSVLSALVVGLSLPTNAFTPRAQSSL